MTEAVVATDRGVRVVRRRPRRFRGLLVSDSVIPPLEAHLMAAGRRRREQAAFLCGYVLAGSVGLVTTVLLPDTDGSLGGCRFSVEAMARTFQQTRRLRQVFLAQVHTHPGPYCGHSFTDDHGAIVEAAGFFSIVVPWFGREGLSRLFSGGAAVHERTPDGAWRLLPTRETRRRFVIIPARCAVI